MQTSKSYDESGLLRLLSEGSLYAFTQVFNCFRDRVYGASYHILKSRQLAEEIVQDVFMKIWLKRSELAEIEHLDAFLFTIARNMTFDKLKHLAYEAVLKTEASGRACSTCDTDHRLQYKQYEMLLNETINLLPPQQKRVYLLSKESGLDCDEIGRQLKISRFTAKKHLAVALKFIRKNLSKHLGMLIAILLLSQALEIFI